MSGIKTSYEPPPIPDRRFDWRAWHEPDDSEGRHVGWGRTEREALEDLLRLDQERTDYLARKMQQECAS